MKSIFQVGLSLTALALVSIPFSGCGSSTETIELNLVHTTDVHGHLLTYDYVRQTPADGGMARLSTLMKQIRAEHPNTLLLDGGDMLQGEPINYQSNYIDTLSPNAVGVAMNALGYDAATIGNHDIEPGHRVYDALVKDVKFPILGANVIDEKTGKPYFTPYTMIERGGARVAVLGLTTPAIPQWLPEHLWRGLRFDDIIKSAEVWVQQIHKQEHPDLLVALIHSGLDNDNADYFENAGRKLAETIEGIDLILIGHDHREYVGWIKRSPTDSVLVVNPSNGLKQIAQVRIKLERSGGKVVSKHFEPILTSVNAEPDTEFVSKMKRYEEGVQSFLGKRIGLLSAPVVARESLFGPSGYMQVMHEMQMRTINAEVSMAAPLNISAELSSGDLYVRDLFRWCPFSNHLYAMDLTGAEIKGYLEHSYAGWANHMRSKDDHLIQMRSDAQPTDRYKTAVPTFNYSAAHGIDYIVDVSKPAGQRIHILQMSNGEPFDLNRHYRCAINSYRAGGAGGMLTTGAGIPKDELRKRILEVAPFDQFMSLMKYIEIKGVVNPERPTNWRFVPEGWAKEGAKRSDAFLQ